LQKSIILTTCNSHQNNYNIEIEYNLEREHEYDPVQCSSSLLSQGLVVLLASVLLSAVSVVTAVADFALPPESVVSNLEWWELL